MKKMMIGIVAGFLFLAMAPLSSHADPCGCGGPGGEGGMGMGMHHGSGFREREHLLWKSLMQLNLSDKQKEALAAIRSRVTKEVIRKRADLEVAQVELRDLLAREPVDMKAVEASLKKAEALRTDLRLARIKAREEVKAQLTPEQRTQLKENIRAHAGRRMEGVSPDHERMHSAGRTGGE